jgi:phosphatidylglycerophosphate synthase
MDKSFSDFVLNNVHMFKYISPNIITLIGFIINIIIAYLIFYYDIKNKCIFNIFVAFMILRWALDNIDGGIARKYNKESDFGSVFDTVSDTILWIIFAIYLTKCNMYVGCVYIIICLMFYYYPKYETHQQINKIKNNIIYKIHNYILKNTYIAYLISILIVYYVNC